MSWRWPGWRRSMWPRRRPWWCTRVPREGSPGRFVTRVWPVGATTNEIIGLADHLAGEQVEKVVLESTSDYWQPFFYLMEAAGLHVELVNARDVKNAPGRPETDKLDAVWLAKLAGWGMLRPSFVPLAEIRQLRDYTRLRTDLTRERTRHWQRLEKLLEDALIKVTTVASRIDTMSVRDMAEALIAGQRDPRRLADLARGRMKAKRAALIEALTGRFDAHHGELAAILLAQIDGLTAQIDALSARTGELIAAIPAAQGVSADGTTGPQAGRGPDAAVLPAIDRLAEIPGHLPARRRGHGLAPAGRPRHTIRRPRRGLLHQHHRHRPQGTQPHPPAPGTRLHRDYHHPGCRITSTSDSTRSLPRPGWEIFLSAPPVSRISVRLEAPTKRQYARVGCTSLLRRAATRSRVTGRGATRAAQRYRRLVPPPIT
jgi:transposase